MKLRLLAASLAALSLSAGMASAQDLSSERGKLSYAIGFNTGAELAELSQRGETVDVSAVIKAIQDAYARKEPAVPVDDLRAAVDAMQQRLAQKMQEEFNALAAANKAASDVYLAQNKTNPGVQELPGGVQYRVIERGTGAKPSESSDIQLSYKGTLPNGTVLVDTEQAPEGQQPGPVSLKVNQIPLTGLREALVQMPAGSRWEIVLPGEKAYGATIEAGRMANQAVIFDVKLVSVR